MPSFLPVPPLLPDCEPTQTVRDWWHALPRAQRLALLRSRLRDDARDPMTELGRRCARHLLRQQQRPAPRAAREDPRRWGERDRYEYWVDRCRQDYLYTARGFRTGAPNLLTTIEGAWDNID